METNFFINKKNYILSYKLKKFNYCQSDQISIFLIIQVVHFVFLFPYISLHLFHFRNDYNCILQYMFSILYSIHNIFLNTLSFYNYIPIFLLFQIIFLMSLFYSYEPFSLYTLLLNLFNEYNYQYSGNLHIYRITHMFNHYENKSNTFLDNWFQYNYKVTIL